MELPHQYPYNPRLGLILLVSGVGTLWIAVQWLSCDQVLTGFSLCFGLVPITLAVLLGVRRISFERYLRLDTDSLVLPTGLFQMRMVRIEYTSIERVWRHYLPLAVVLRVTTKTRNFEIVSVL